MNITRRHTETTLQHPNYNVGRPIQDSRYIIIRLLSSGTSFARTNGYQAETYSASWVTYMSAYHRYIRGTPLRLLYKASEQGSRLQWRPHCGLILKLSRVITTIIMSGRYCYNIITLQLWYSNATVIISPKNSSCFLGKFNLFFRKIQLEFSANSTWISLR